MHNKYSWYTANSEDNVADTVHQTLAFGTLEDIAELKKEIGIEKITRYFIENINKAYTQPSLNFISNFLLPVHDRIEPHEYLKSTPRNI